MASILKVDAVAKQYGRHQALYELSFSAEKGEIIALLGCNGAGKSTLMNILTGYIAMTSGSVSVAGVDMQAEALEAKRHLGYLPERPPLYPEITVTEYLRYCSALKGLSRAEASEEIQKAIHMTGLGDYRRRLTGQLSKGYRQRLGLAQALLGKPDLLILDEPGSGLDPMQMSQLREVIRAASGHSAVILSSHILSEVTDMCSRAIVLDRGHCLYDGSMEKLLDDRRTVRAVWRGGSGVAEALASVPGLHMERAAERQDGTRTALLHPEDEAAGNAIAPTILRCGAALLMLAPEAATLESAFLHLIGDREANA